MTKGGAMTAAHIHLLLNHIPILGNLFGFFLWLYGVFKRSSDLKIAALWTFLIVGLITVPVYLTGDGTAEIVGSLPGVSIDLIARHDNAATITLVAIELLALASLLALWVSRASGEIKRWMASAVLVLAFISSALAIWTGSIGGQIRHTEVRAGFSK
jgi:hypothetical protein